MNAIPDEVIEELAAALYPLHKLRTPWEKQPIVVKAVWLRNVRRQMDVALPILCRQWEAERLAAAQDVAQRYTEEGRIPLGRYYLTLGVEVDENHHVIGHFDVSGGVNIVGFWQANKTRIEPVEAAGDLR